MWFCASRRSTQKEEEEALNWACRYGNRLVEILRLLSVSTGCHCEAEGQRPLHSIYISTPFVLGTSLPPVLATASLIASANALNEASALSPTQTSRQPKASPRRKSGGDEHVVVVDSPDRVDVQRDAGGDGERLEDVRNHLGRDCELRQYEAWDERKGERTTYDLQSSRA